MHVMTSIYKKYDYYSSKTSFNLAFAEPRFFGNGVFSEGFQPIYKGGGVVNTLKRIIIE